MVFIQAGEAHADRSRQQKQPDAPHPVYIEGKRDRDRQKEIFRHMGQLPHRIMNSFDIIPLLLRRPVQLEGLVGRLHNDLADLIAQIARHISILRRKAENQVHHQNRRNKGKRFQNHP